MEKNPDVVAIQKIVDKCLNKTKYSYPMYQNAPRPPTEKFAAVRLLGSRNPGYDQKYRFERNGKYIFRTEGIRELAFDILFNRDDQDVITFDNSFFRDDVQDLCAELGYELLRKKPTNLRNKNLETNWEIRTGISCVFSVIRVQESEYGVVETFPVAGKFNEADKTTDFEINLDLTKDT